MACMTCLRTDDDEQQNNSSDSGSENGGNGNGKDKARRMRFPPPCRWRCTFCCLRICTECKQGLVKCKDRSLMVFMEELVTALERQGKEEKGQLEDDSQ